MTEGAGRPRWAWQGDSAGARANTDMKPQLHSFPGSSQHIPPECTHWASPWRLSVITSHARYQSHATSTAGFAKACEHIFYLQKTNTEQNKGLPFHFFSLTITIPHCNPFWCPHSLLCRRFWPATSLSYHWHTSLLLHFLLLISAAPIATCHQSFLELRTSFSIFLSPLCSSQFFTPVSTWELLSMLSAAPSPLFLLYFLSWQLSLVQPCPFSSAIRPCPVCWWCL